MIRVPSALAGLAVLALITACGSSSPESAPTPASSSDPAQCVVADPQGELILHPGSLTAPAGGERLEGVSLDHAENLEVLKTYTVAFTGSPTVRGVILDYPPMKNAGLADSLADWDQRQPLVGRRLSAEDGQQAVLVVLRLSDAATPGHLTGVSLAATTGDRDYPQPLLIKPHGRPCTVDDIASTKSWSS
jgi:hypothetical protein